jgi:HD-GYP domain-containing protein (c-di-GMP phosphodiesterase class II)
MKQSSSMVFRERIFAALLLGTGAWTLVLSLKNVEASSIHFREYGLTLFLAAVMVVLDRYPIHLLRGTKLSLVNLPMFLLPVLVPAPLAILAIGAALFIANILARAERGLLPRDIAATVGQWMFTAFVGNQIIHLSLPGIHGPTSRLTLLLLCAISFILIDFFVFSLSQAFMYGEPFLLTLRTIIQEGFFAEAIQYLIAVLGAIAAAIDLWSLVLLIVPASVTYIAFKNLKETRYETVQILQDLADTVDLRDIYTGGHSRRVANLVRETLVQLKIAGPEASLIELAARLHDIGKIGIPDAVLMKPGKLSAEEMAVMQTHSQKGAELLSRYKDFSRGSSIIMHHHERWDGMGYPTGLKGYEIPFGARVIAVADSFDAMTSNRPYRDALSTSLAIQILLEGRAKQWEAAVVNAFVEMITRKIDEKSGEDLFSQHEPASHRRAAPIPS